MAKKLATIYGVHAVEKVFKQSPEAIVVIRFTLGGLNRRQQSLYDQAQTIGINVERVPKAYFDRLQGNHQGIMAEVKSRGDYTETTLTGLVKSVNQPLIIFLDEVQDPHNLGAILRTADAAGAHAVVVPKHNSAGLNATVRKVASGAAESVPLIVVANLSRTLKEMQQEGMWLIGLAGEASHTIYEQDLTGSIGIVMGSEGSGLRRLSKESCDHLAAIPMLGTVESLNVSVATGVVVYEAYRQRAQQL